MSEETKKEYTLEDISKHNTVESCWLIIGNLNNGAFFAILFLMVTVTWSMFISSGFLSIITKLVHLAFRDDDCSVLFACSLTFVQFIHFVTNCFTIGGPKVYDVTKYLDDHPGGAEVMLDVAGQDADEFFEDIGHSNDARAELKKHYIGDYKIDEAALAKMKADAEKAAALKNNSSSTLLMVLVALLAIAFGYYKTQM
jgi:cytochrome b involved in lipid metabolism